MLRENTRNSIQNAFVELYKTYGIEDITVDMICKKAYISRSTFYKYYRNTDALVSEIEDTVREEMARINEDYNYQSIFDIDIDYPSPNFMEMFRCVLRYKDFFYGALSAHGNPSFYTTAKKTISYFLKDHILQHDKNVRHLDIICDICSEYILSCCKYIITYENELSIKGMAIQVKKFIIDMVNNSAIYLNDPEEKKDMH